MLVSVCARDLILPRICQDDGKAHACSQAAVVTPRSTSTARSNTVVLAKEQG